MKVLWIIPGKGEGSSFIFSRRQIDELQMMGVEGRCFFLESRTNFSYLKSARQELKAFIDEYEPDIVHAHYGSINGWFAVRLAHPNTIITFQGSDLNKNKAVSSMRFMLTKKASAYSLKKTAFNIVVSQQLKDKIPEKYHERTIIIPLGVDEGLFKPMPRDRARKKLKWAAEEKVVIFNGNNPEVKRLDIALKVIEIVKKTYPEARLEVLKGEVNPAEIPLLLNASDVLLLCSDSEGSPTIIKEAMACNLPIVSNIVGDTQQRLENVKGAILTTQDPDDLAKNIIATFANNDCTHNNLRESFMAQKLSQAACCEKVLSIYEDLLNGKR